MMKNAYALLLITLAGSAQAITWAEYYAAHQAEVNAAVTTAPHYLDLANKGLTDLNGFDAVPGLNTLEWLYLNNNQLRELPPTIFHSLDTLQRLNLDSNQFRALPPTIFQGLNALQSLTIQVNQLITFPPTIFQGLNSLEVLYLDNNQLSELPPTIFQGLNSLQVLSLQDNQLRAFPPAIFQGLNMLQMLYLDNNQLRELPPTVFQTLSALQQLTITNNQLRELPPTIFHGLDMLAVLYLNRNQLRELPPAVFQGLNALQDLYLSSNQLRALPPTIFQGLNALREISLSFNQIPGTNAKLRATLRLPNNVGLVFKTPDQEYAESLFAAIGQSNIATVRQLINDLVSGRILNPEGFPILISTLRDYDGNNLLHAAIISAARHLASIAGKSLNVQGNEGERNAQRAKLAKDKSIINARYMKLIDAIFACSELGAQEMLATPNAAGQNVVQAAIEKLGLHNSPITEALLKLGLPDVDVKAKLALSGDAALRRPLEPRFSAPRFSDESKSEDVEMTDVATQRFLETQAHNESHGKALSPANVVLRQLQEGNAYYFGAGGMQDYDKARGYFEQAERQNVNPGVRAAAQLRLGEMYLYGKGVEQSFNIARGYLQQAARYDGNPSAQYLAQKKLAELEKLKNAAPITKSTQ